MREYSKYVDVDMANARPQLLLDLISEKSPDTPSVAIARYCSNYPLWRKAVAEYAGISIEASKLELTKVFYGARPFCELPFLMQLTRSDMR